MQKITNGTLWVLIFAIINLQNLEVFYRQTFIDDL